MLIKTVVDIPEENTKIYKCSCKAVDTENTQEEFQDNFQNIELNLCETEYDDTFIENLSREISEYHIHTVFDYDYESSSDAGDGRDECYSEEEDIQINLNDCIIKNNKFYGVMCESFECKAFVLIDFPETVIGHPGNYGGRNYHFYRYKRFKLVKK